MKAMKFKHKWVLVTGASSGLGYEMAVQFAKKHKANVILVARRKEKLEALKQKLVNDYKVKCEIITADLTIEADVDRVFETATQIADIYGVVLNAGVTYFGEHKNLEWDYFKTLLDTNVKSVVRLTDLFTPYLIEKKQKGGIMYVASMAGLTPIPFQAAYSGTKAFIINFGLSYHREMQKQPLSITIYAPGGIDTELTKKAGLDFFDNSGLMQTAEDCALDGIAAFKSRKMLKVPGVLNQAQILLTRIAPRALTTKITGRTYQLALNSLNNK